MTNIAAIILTVVFIIIVLFLTIGPVCYNYRRDNFDEITTKIMSDIENVPTIKLIEKDESKNLFQRILSPTNSKIKFNIIINENGNYDTIVPNYENYNFTGKGLVIAASGNRYRYVTGLYSNLYTLRKYHKSNIPVEIFYVGEIEKFSIDIEKLLKNLGNIKIINLMDRISSNLTEEDVRGYQTKPISAMCSSFSEVILMDADALCFLDPYYLFDADGYKTTGMILFKDYVDCLSFISKDFIDTIGIGMEKYCSYTNNYEIDSSCVVINKEKYWDALFTISIINVKSENYHKSKNVLGDKDTWLIGSMFLDLYPKISSPSPYVFVNDNNKLVVGHLQSTEFSDSGKTKEVFTHLNNQKCCYKSINLSGWTYATVKNPKNNQEIVDGIPIPGKILDCFKYAKEAMEIIYPILPAELTNGVIIIDGVSKGLIP
jgi:hypothetical protein